jgi:hypothetical protein
MRSPGIVVRKGGGIGDTLATANAEDFPLTRVATPIMLRAVRRLSLRQESRRPSRIGPQRQW